VLHRVSSHRSYRLFGSPIPLRRCLRSPLGSSDRRLPRKSKGMRFVLSRASDPLQRPRLVLPVLASTAEAIVTIRSASRGLLRPSNATTPASRLRRHRAPVARVAAASPGTNHGRHPPSAFLGPLRVSSSQAPAALFHAADAHGVSTVRSVSLPASSSRLVAGRSPLGLFRLPPKRLAPGPQGFTHAGSPYPPSEYFIRATGRCSLRLSIISAAL
jgi:hypothetical protein